LDHHTRRPLLGLADETGECLGGEAVELVPVLKTPVGLDGRGDLPHVDQVGDEVRHVGCTLFVEEILFDQRGQDPVVDPEPVLGVFRALQDVVVPGRERLGLVLAATVLDLEPGNAREICAAGVGTTLLDPLDQTLPAVPAQAPVLERTPHPTKFGEGEVSAGLDLTGSELGVHEREGMREVFARCDAHVETESLEDPVDHAHVGELVYVAEGGVFAGPAAEASAEEAFGLTQVAFIALEDIGDQELGGTPLGYWDRHGPLVEVEFSCDCGCHFSPMTGVVGNAGP